MRRIATRRTDFGTICWIDTRLVIATLFVMVCSWASGMGPQAARAAGPQTQPAPASRGETGQTVILNEGSSWRYFLTSRKPVYRKGQDLLEVKQGTASIGIDSALPPTGWAAPDFDDQPWMAMRGPFFRTQHGWAYQPIYDGKGLIGYDGTSESMALLCIRGKFNVADPKSVGDLTLSLTYRGGVIVYLNGKEVARGSLADPEKKGLEALGDDYATAALETRIRNLTGVKIPADSLRQGINVLAVEVHRSPYTEAIRKVLAPHDVQQFDWLPMGLVNLELKAAGAGAAPNVERPRGLQVWAQSPASPVDASQYGNPLEGAQPVRLFGTRNAVAAGEVVVGSPQTIADLKVECSDLVGPGTLPVEVRYGVADASVFFKGAFFSSYDVLDPAPPTQVPAEKTGGAVQPVLLTVRVPKNAKPGTYKGKVTAKAAGAAPVELPVELSVADWAMTDARDFQTQMGLYESPESAALQYKLDLWSEDNWKLVDKVFACMAELGADDVYIPVESRMHLGNSQSMVRWIPKEGGPSTVSGRSYIPDFSLVEKYLDIAIKHLGKPANVCFLLWDYNNNKLPPEGGFRFTTFDPKTGKAEEVDGPRYGTPEIREFLKPVAEGIRKVVKERGLESSMMLGIIGDGGPTKEVFADLDALFPGTKWEYSAHDLRFNNEKIAAYRTCVYCQYVPSEPVDGKRKYGWQAKWRLSCNRREQIGTGSPPLIYREELESRLLCGFMGISRLGADFWPVLGRPGSLGQGALGRRYPDVDWYQLNFGVSTGAVLAPGKDGPLGTLRFEALRAGAQESEARIFIEKALVDPAQKAKLGEELANRCQKELDDRQRQLILFLSSGHYYTGMGWEAKAGELFRLAGEVAKRLAS